MKARRYQERPSQCEAASRFIISVHPEESASILDLAELIRESVEAAAEEPMLDDDAGVTARTRSRQKHRKVTTLPEESQTLQKLLETARLRFSKHISSGDVHHITRSWDNAVSACSAAWGAPDNLSAVEEQRLTKASWGCLGKPSVVSCEWLLRCWSELRCVPLEEAIGSQVRLFVSLFAKRPMCPLYGCTPVTLVTCAS